MFSPRSLAAFLLGVAAFTTAAPVAETAYPEVIPGPGLPSLSSLNLTSAELYTKEPDFSTLPPIQTLPIHKRAALFTNECGPDDGAYTDVNDIIACYNYLNNLGHTSCSAGANDAVEQMCKSGSGQVVGQAINGVGSSSYCSDVALAVLWVINDCTRPDQSVAGFSAANGNGNLIIGAVNTDY